MKVIFLPTTEAVVAINKYLCEQGGNPHHCNEPGKIESAISTAFYPGTYPFALGGLAKVAGALTAITFLNQHGIELQYPLDPDNGVNGLAEVIEKCAASGLGRDELMAWFEAHKTWIDE